MAHQTRYAHLSQNITGNAAQYNESARRRLSPKQRMVKAAGADAGRPGHAAQHRADKSDSSLRGLLNHDRIVAAVPIAGVPPLPREIDPGARRERRNVKNRDMKAEAGVAGRFVRIFPASRYGPNAR